MIVCEGDRVSSGGGGNGSGNSRHLELELEVQGWLSYVAFEFGVRLEPVEARVLGALGAGGFSE